MMSRLAAILVTSAALAAIAAGVAGTAPGWLQSLMAVLVVWTLVSITATAFILPWFHATVVANEALTQTARPAEWKGRIAIR